MKAHRLLQTADLLRSTTPLNHVISFGRGSFWEVLRMSDQPYYFSILFPRITLSPFVPAIHQNRRAGRSDGAS